MMKEKDGIARVKSDLSQTYEQYDVKVDQDKATEKGISAAQLALVLNENMPEQTITKVKDKGNSIDVKVKQDKQNDWSKQKIRKYIVPITNRRYS